jgi:hypothetical protein
MKTRWLGVVAAVTSLAALTCTIVAHHILEPRPQTRTRMTFELKKFKIVRETITPPDEPAPLVTPDRLQWTAIGLATAAAFLSILSWIRREGLWLGFIACTFAAAAVAWKEFVIVFALLFMTGLLFIFLPSERSRPPAPTVKPSEPRP